MSWDRFKALLFHTPCPAVRPPHMKTSPFRCQLHAHHKGVHIFMAYLREDDQ